MQNDILENGKEDSDINVCYFYNWIDNSQDKEYRCKRNI